MREASQFNQVALTDLVVKILELPNHTLTELDLRDFSENEELGMKIMNALFAATSTLNELKLRSSKSWWKDELCFSLLLIVLQKQKLLKTLNLSSSKFTD